MPRKTQMTPDEIRAGALDRLFRELSFCPEPTYTFSVGERVEIGNLDNAAIVEVIENGKIYEVEFDNTDRDGELIGRKRSFWYWYSLRPESLNVDNDIIQNEDIQFYFQSRDVWSLLNSMYSFGIDMEPVYQRDYVWSEWDEQELIKSIFNNIDIGKFVVANLPYKDNNSPMYEIIDGKQRLHTLARFYENRFPVYGIYYNMLSAKEKFHFGHYPIAYAELRRASLQQRLRAFLMLNQTGKVMSPEHLKKVRGLLE